MNVPLYIGHKLTAYHLRDRMGRKPTRTAICQCGWKCRLLRTGFRGYLRQAPCLARGHQWGEWDPSEVGAVYEKTCPTCKGAKMVWGGDPDRGIVGTGKVCPDCDGDGEVWVSEIDEGKGTIIGYVRQCDRCYKCETKD